MSLVVDLREGVSSRFHFKRFFYFGHQIRNRNATMSNMFGFITTQPKADRFKFEATWRWPGYAFIFLDKFLQTTLRICGCLLALFFVGYINEKFNDATMLAFRNGIVEGVDRNPPLTDPDLVELGIIDVTREAGIIP